MKKPQLLTMFLILRAAMLAVVLFFFARLIPYKGFFPYVGIIENLSSIKPISSLANFDGVHYILIATQGYSQYEQAFFPMFPLFIRSLNTIIKNPLYAGLTISNVSFLISIVLLIKLLAKINAEKKFRFILLYLSFPTAFYLHALYTESLFILLLAASTFLFFKKSYLGIFFAFLASTTRITGAFLFFIYLPFVVSAIIHKKKQDIVRVIFFTLAPLFGLFLYMAYLWRTTGDPVFFLTSQPAFGAQRSTTIITLPQVFYRYAKILLFSNKNFSYWIAVFELSTTVLALISLVYTGWYIFKNMKKNNFISIFYTKKNTLVLGLFLYSTAVIIAPTLTGTLSSMPRYVLLAPTVFMFLSDIKSTKILTTTIIAFFILQLILFSFFIQGYFIS